MSNPQKNLSNYEARNFQLPRVALCCLTGVIGCLAVKEAVGGRAQGYHESPLEVSIANGLIVGVLFAAVLYPIFRHLARRAGPARGDWRIFRQPHT